MKYIDAINSVLRHLREPTVSSARETPESILVGNFINDAIEIVGNAYAWEGNRRISYISTADNTRRHQQGWPGWRTDIQNTDTILSVQILTTGKTLVRNELNPGQVLSVVGRNIGEPEEYYTYGLPHTTITDVHETDGQIYRAGVQTIYLDKVPPEPITLAIYHEGNPADFPINQGEAERIHLEDALIVIPPEPVIAYALAFSVRERGEAGPQEQANYFSVAERTLRDTIALQTNHRDIELSYYSV